MPALGGASAEPLRFLDFLIRNPVRTVILHEAGIPVTVPAPERYAVHKLIVADRRHESSRSKVDKDVGQASVLIHVMSERRALNLAEAWQEDWERGSGWTKTLVRGLEHSKRTRETGWRRRW